MPPLPLNREQLLQKVVTEANLDELLRIMGTLDQETRTLVLNAMSRRLNIQRKGETISAIRRAIATHGDEVKDWLLTAVADSYISGANAMLADLNKLGINPLNGNAYTQPFTQDTIRQLDLLTVHRDAVNALVSDAYLDFANGINGITRSAERQLNEATKRQIRAVNISGQITGADIRTISNEIRDTIGQQGFTTLIDRGGKRWSIPNYSRMLARTHTIASYNDGTINRAVDWGVDLVQVSQHPHTPDICSQYEGRIYSISGRSEEYPPLTVRPPFHPNCRHSLLPRPYAEDI